MEKFTRYINLIRLPGIVIPAVCFFFLLGSASIVAETSATADNAAVEEAEYLLDVGDVIEIAVWRNPELSKTVTIRPDGRISLPLAGEITAAGTTPAQLSALITASLGHTYIKDPKVTVIVDEVGSKQVLVLGEVRSPGLYTMSHHLTTFKAIGQAGGQNKYAHLESTIVVRNSQMDKPNVYMIDLRKVLKKGGADNFVIQPGDIVYVPRSFLGKVDDLTSFFATNIAPLVNTYFFYKALEDND